MSGDGGTSLRLRARSGRCDPVDGATVALSYLGLYVPDASLEHTYYPLALLRWCIIHFIFYFLSYVIGYYSLD